MGKPTKKQKDGLKRKIVSSSTTSRNFSYAQDNINLNFSLRIDIVDNLKVFKELLLMAVKDVDDQIEMTKQSLKK